MDRTEGRGLSGSVALLAFSGALVFLLAAHPARAAWDGTQLIVPGDRVSARFSGAPGSETHLFTFYAADDATLGVSWKPAHGEVLAIRVLDPDLQPVNVASHTKGNRIKRLKLSVRGRHTIEVSTKAGTGRYSLKTQVTYPGKYGGKGIATPASGTYDFEIGMPAGTSLKAKVKKSKRSTAAPTFASLTGPRGAVDLGAANPSVLKKVSITSTGPFTLAVAGGNGEKIDLEVRPKFPVGTTAYTFDEIETTAGSATEIRTAWLGSAHADLTSEPFAHWNNDSPAVVPQACSKCHSGLGYRDFLGVLANPNATPPESAPSSNLNDPSPSPGQGQVASGPWPVGTPVNCDTCHNDVTRSLTEVTFPSGLKVTGLGDESRCMVCHQGRESTVSVEKRISDAYAAAKIVSDDTVSSAVNFLNVHYFSAAGSLYGREAEVAYEYPDPAKSGLAADPVTGLKPRLAYDRKFAHVASKDVCFECHDQHTLKVRVTECAGCHVDRNGDPIVTAAPTNTAEYEAAIDKLHEVRMAGTINDFNGNGDIHEGVYAELVGLREKLFTAIRGYANTPKTNAAGAPVAATPIAYSPTTYPYFFVDANNNGTVDPDETTAYNAWTARLLRAAYDYQYAQKDPGAFAHNAKYLIEFLYDAIADLNSVTPVADFAKLVRNDSGHFDTSAEVYRHWDEDTDHLVDPSCARCHSPEGFLFRAKYGIDQTIPAQLSSGMTCETCHETGANFSPLNGNKPARRYIGSVTFPVPTTATSTQIAAVTITNGPKGGPTADESFICMTCHQGRESTLTVDAADPGASKTAFTVSFRNVHYLAAGATQYGSKAAVAYQYPTKSYAPPWIHSGTIVDGTDTKRCQFCHMQDGSHSFKPEVVTVCTQCHGIVTLDQIGPPAFAIQHDYDGNPATKSKAEVAVFADRLYQTIQDYCAAKTNQPSPPQDATYTAYNGAAYPYWFKDTNPHNGMVDPSETTAMKFDSKSARAAFNYQFYQKEPGAWAHNNKYIVQILYDSIDDLDAGLGTPGAHTAGLTRP
jgi:hypothetical protein